MTGHFDVGHNLWPAIILTRHFWISVHFWSKIRSFFEIRDYLSYKKTAHFSFLDQVVSRDHWDHQMIITSQFMKIHERSGEIDLFIIYKKQFFISLSRDESGKFDFDSLWQPRFEVLRPVISKFSKIFSVKEDELNLVASCRCKMLILLSWLDIKKDYFVSTRYEELIKCTWPHWQWWTVLITATVYPLVITLELSNVIIN